MTDTTPTAMTVRAPWHFWVVGILALLWTGLGAFDFVMNTVRGEAYLREAGMTEAMIAQYNAMPAWMHIPQIAGVWGAIGGTILLLIKKRIALPVYLVSLAGYVVSLVYNYSNSKDVTRAGALLDSSDNAAAQSTQMSMIIFAVVLFLTWYSWMMSRKSVLR